MSDPIIAALPAVRADGGFALPDVVESVAALPSVVIAVGLPEIGEHALPVPRVPVLLMPSGTVAMLPVRYGVQFTANGGFTVAAVAVHPAAVEFSAAATFDAVAFEVQTRAVVFSGEGLFVASDIPRRFVEFTGAGGFAVEGIAVFSAPAEFSGIGAVVIVKASQVQARSVQFAGVGALAASAMQLQARVAQFAGTGTFGAAGVQVYSRTVQFAGVGGFSAVGTIKKSYTDDFNRANGAIGSNWGPSSPQPVVNTNAAQNSTASGNTPQLVEYLGGMMATDNYAVTATIKTPVGTSRVTTTYFYLLARGNGTATQDDDRVLLVLSGAALSSGFYTINSAGTISSRHVAISTAFVTGDTVTLEVNGNVYTAKRNGTTIATFTDSSGIVPVNAGHRGFGFGTQPYNSGYGFAFDQIVAEDL
ncbi:hypothetical protein ACFWDA_24355 [Rhodococcus zopfii]|uniref:hypothetical protein n=1 Tax=Rhodococcus TaxID=1827 RepID=UPI00082DC08B|nr:hypothetical protein [Rhodococcus phenolicus]